ncbi:MAG: hypothetical protein ABSD38_20500 [Syntrophorhabdales bacterium]|jgi:hypothetical protein
MTGTKYDNLFTNDCVVRSEVIGMSMITTRKMEGFGEGNFSMDCFYVTYSKVFGEAPHRHSFAQYMCFLSANPVDTGDFDAEVEVHLGDEGEKHVITSPTIAYIPAGLSHGPLNFARIGKPVLFLDIATVGKYSRL